VCRSALPPRERPGNVGLGQRELILCPVSDESSLSVGGGSHWSLLAHWRRPERASDADTDVLSAAAPSDAAPAAAAFIFKHFDSCGSLNAAAAQATADVLAKALSFAGPSDSTETTGGAALGGGGGGGGGGVLEAAVEAVDVPRQTNGVDCGLHALLAARLHLDCLLAALRGTGQEPPPPPLLPPAAAAAPAAEALVRSSAGPEALGPGAAAAHRARLYNAALDLRGASS